MAAAAFIATWSLPAVAQTSLPDVVVRSPTVTGRLRPDYAPAGVRLGGFRLDGNVDAGVGYSDNLAPTAPERLTGIFLDEALRLSLSSDWTRHAVSVTASQATRRHPDAGSLDWTDYQVGLGGRYDIGRASSVSLGYSHIRGHLEVTDFDVQQSTLNRPLPFDSDVFQASGIAAFNRITLGGSAEYRTVRYNGDEAFLPRRTFGDGRDYDRVTGEATAAYSFLPGRDVMMITRVTDISYLHKGLENRDSLTWEVLAGLRYDLTGLWGFRVAVGYRQRDYEDPVLRDRSSPAFEGQLLYLPSPLTTVTLTAQRSIEESTRATNVSYTRTLVRLNVDHELLRNVIVSAELRGERRNYDRPDESVTDAVGILSAQVFFNRRVSMLASYQRYERLQASAGIQEFDQNLFLLRLRFTL
ncbi:outer membrane beta-barrel protein [Teichococcus wenyumeiae]|uniref:outer membrane beta-barrel protein n=1 Tax=Teichococcus wenyumeiae TaxID=2478470 RepID=UPI0013142763|nr:outer membrane beta-barrel protein [Pseudoroseomonas wenyumeiae]